MNPDAEDECWRVIPSLLSYLASSHGRIMRVPFTGSMPHGGKRHYGGCPWFGVWSPNEKRFILVVEGHTYKVHRLICEAFHGEAPSLDSVCLHLDESSKNNRPDNLKWGTQKENLSAPGYIAYCHSRIGEKSPWKKYLAKQRAEKINELSC